MKELDNHFNNSCWVVFLHPITFVVPDDENPWEVKLDDINNITYNNGNLIRIVSKFNIENSELPGLICYDGAIAIPKSVNFQNKESALNYFSELFTKLLLADFYVEGIDHKDIVNGTLYEKWAIWPTDLGNSHTSNLHSKIRMKTVSNIDTIYLSNPRVIYVSDLLNKINLGNSILQKVPNLTSKYLLRGLTEYKYKNWDLVLSNLWITIEQLIDYIWSNMFLNNEDYHPKLEIPNRKKSLKEDSRTWSASVKQELLYQKNLIDDDILNKLSKSRKIRNKLVHQGQTVKEETAKDILEVVIKLIKYIVPDSSISFNLKNLSTKKINITDPNFNDWKELTNSNFVENVFRKDITSKIKK